MAVDVESRRTARARASAIGKVGQQRQTPRRRRGRIAAGVTLLIVCGWLAAVIFTSVGSRREVLSLAHQVEQFSELKREDLRVVRVAADPDVDVVPADRIDELVGRVAATDLVDGSLLDEDQLLERDERLVGADEAVVGAVLAAGDSPGNLAAGADVEVVVRQPAGTTGGPQTIPGWVLKVEDTESPGVQASRVSLVIPSDSVAMVSAAAAESRVSVAVVGGS